MDSPKNFFSSSYEARSISGARGLIIRDLAQVDRVGCASRQTPPPRLGAQSSTSHGGVSHNHSEASGSHSMNQLPNRNVPKVHVNHANQASSSSIVDRSNLCHLAMGNARGPYKRKCPGVPPIGEASSAKGLFRVGSSSVSSSSTGLLQERSKVQVNRRSEPTHLTPTFRSNHLPSGGESFMRNVRSRPSIELKSDTYGINPCSKNLTRSPSGLSILSNHPRQDQTVPLPDPNPVIVPAVPCVQRMVPGTSRASNEMNQVVNGNSVSNVSNVSGQTVCYHHNLTTRRDPSIQSSAASLSPAASNAVANYSQRVNMTRAAVGNGNPRVGYITPANPALSQAAGIPSLGQSRPSPSVGRVGHGTARPGCSAQGNQPISVNATPRIAAPSSRNASRNVSDLHRNIRLNIDRMSYEQLLALGERIGTVNTGVRPDLFPKCLIDMIYFSLKPEEERCLICLEDYESMDLLAAIKACNHDYHRDCIKKWLSIKNSCPICKVAALPDNEK